MPLLIFLLKNNQSNSIRWLKKASDGFTCQLIESIYKGSRQSLSSNSFSLSLSLISLQYPLIKSLYKMVTNYYNPPLSLSLSLISSVCGLTSCQLFAPPPPLPNYFNFSLLFHCICSQTNIGKQMRAFKFDFVNLKAEIIYMAKWPWSKGETTWCQTTRGETIWNCLKINL